MRDTDQRKLADQLLDTVGYYEFQPGKICSPLDTNESSESALTLVRAYFPDSDLAVFPAPVVVPINSVVYQGLCKAALNCESDLLKQWTNDRRNCDKQTGLVFGEELTKHPLALNILRRMKAFEQIQQHIGAGIYLGSRKSDDTLGDLLLHKVQVAYEAAGLPKNETIPLLCKQWGTIQANARTLITEESWRALVKRDSWPVPEGFSENMTYLLEDRVARVLRGTDQSPRMTESEIDSFWEWYSQVETLHEIRPKPEVLLRLERVRDFMRSGVKEPPAELAQDLVNSGNAAWLAVLKDPSPSNIARFRDSIWKKSREIAPIALALKDGCPNSICISDQQALEHWREYLAHPSIQQIQVISPNIREALPWYNNSQSEKPARDVEMRQLALLPLSPLITYLGTDVDGACVDEVSQLLRAKLQFLETLADNPLWRNVRSEQKVCLEFTSPSAEIIEHFERMPTIYSHSDNLEIGSATYRSESIGILARILSTSE